jgi:hypothetical protein
MVRSLSQSGGRRPPRFGDHRTFGEVPGRPGIIFAAARDDGEGHAGRLPPVVSSLFSIKAAHWRDGIRGTELGARSGRRDSAALSVMSSQLLRGAGGNRRIEHEHEHEHEDEDIAGDTPASTDFILRQNRNRITRKRKFAISILLQDYSDCPEVAAFAAIYGAPRKIILLLEWSKNLLINQGLSGRLMEW